MTVTTKEKELAAVGISVAAGCKPCTNHHVKKVLEAGASDDKINAAVAAAVAVRQSAMEVMEGHALGRLAGEVGEESKDEGASGGGMFRIRELVALGAAFAVNCTSNFKSHREAAKAAGVTEDEIEEIVTLSAFIRGRAISHVERVAGLADKGEA